MQPTLKRLNGKPHWFLIFSWKVLGWKRAKLHKVTIRTNHDFVIDGHEIFIYIQIYYIYIFIYIHVCLYMYIGLYCYNFRFTFCYITLREITELFSGIYQGDISARFQMERNSVFLTHAHVLSRNVIRASSM